MNLGALLLLPVAYLRAHYVHRRARQGIRNMMATELRARSMTPERLAYYSALGDANDRALVERINHLSGLR